MSRTTLSNVASPEVLPPGTQLIGPLSALENPVLPLSNSDPKQPLNWSRGRKILHTGLLSLYTTLVFAVLTIATPLWADINVETGVSFNDLNDAYATSSGVLAIGCIVFVPLAMKFGRRPVYIMTALLMTVSAIWQGRAKTKTDFIGSNVVAGLAGSVNEALFQVTVTDIFFVHQRASANGLYLAAVCLGNYLGPVAAGYVAVSQGWRWAFYYMTIFMGITSVVMIFALEESKFPSPALNGQTAVNATTITKSQDASKTPTVENNFKGAEACVDSGLSAQITNPSCSGDYTHTPIDNYWTRHSLYRLDASSTRTGNSLFRHCYQPFQILVQFPAVAFAALQYGWLVSMLSVVAVTQATIYPAPPYNFSASSVGLMSLPPAIGAILGSVLGGPMVDYLAVQVAKRRNGIHEPETRLWLFLIPGLGLVVGSCLYGLTIAQGMPWIINAIGAGLVGFALGGCGDMALTYVQDSYEHILADALVGVVFVRNAISTILILVVPAWAENMGVYDMFVLCAVLSAVISMTCVPLIIWGRKWRIQLADRYQKFARRQYQ